MQPIPDKRHQFKSILNRRFGRFVVVGISNAIVSYVAFVILFYSDLIPIAVRTPAAQALSYSAGIVWSFVWNRNWAFRQNTQSSTNQRTELYRFVAVQCICLLLSVMLVTLFVDYLNFLPGVGWLLAMAIITAINFFAAHFWVFPTSDISSNAGPEND